MDITSQELLDWMFNDFHQYGRPPKKKFCVLPRAERNELVKGASTVEILEADALTCLRKRLIYLQYAKPLPGLTPNNTSFTQQLRESPAPACQTPGNIWKSKCAGKPTQQLNLERWCNMGCDLRGFTGLTRLPFRSHRSVTHTHLDVYIVMPFRR